MELSCQKPTSVSDKIFDLCRIIPKGPKYYIWFSKDHNANPILYLFPYSKKKDCLSFQPNHKSNHKSNSNSNSNALSSHIITSSFDPLLSIGRGTLCFGTLFHHHNIAYFTIEDIEMIQSKRINRHMSWKDKYVHMFFILSHIKSISCKSSIFIGLPVTRTIDLKKPENIPELQYRIYGIEYLYKNECHKSRLVNNKNASTTYIQNNVKLVNKPIDIKRTFTIKPDIQSDIYKIYEENTDNLKETYIDTVLIPDIKTSQMLNRYFRNIKENENLDLIEESEDEDEFENIEEDKFIKKSSLKFLCSFHNKFKKWIPIQCVDSSACVS